MTTGNSARDWKMWEERYEGLEQVSQVLKGRLENATTNKSEDEVKPLRYETFKALFEGLEEFAGEQFDFLYEGLNPNPNARSGYRLERSLRYPADFVLGATLDQYAFDLTVLQGALEQRLLAIENEEMRKTFEVADRLARHALRPAFEYKLLPYEQGDVRVLTYFQKAANIRIIPYACVALVGIPWTALATYKSGSQDEVGNARDLLAIPHEIGHYVYRHGSGTGGRLQETLHFVLQGKPEWLLNWAEEIFADVYGCFVAGPVIVRDFQDLMRDNDFESFLEDDNAHPTPVLRPLLYCDALTILANKVKGTEDQENAIAVVAEEHWEDFRRGRGTEEEVEERREIVAGAIRQTLDLLVEREPGKLSKDSVNEELWSNPGLDLAPAISGSTRSLYDNLYADFYEKVTSGDLANEPAGDRGQGSGKAMEKNPTLQYLKEARSNARGSGTSERVIPARVWPTIVSMHGWATKGPEDNPDPKIT